MLYLLWSCAEPSVSVWGKMYEGEATISWASVTFHLADTPWNDPWEAIPLLHEGEMHITTQESLIAEGFLPQNDYHHVFTDAAITSQNGEPLGDIIEQIASPFHSDARHKIILEYIIIENNIFTKDCIVQLEWL